MFAITKSSTTRRTLKSLCSHCAPTVFVYICTADAAQSCPSPAATDSVCDHQAAGKGNSKRECSGKTTNDPVCPSWIAEIVVAENLPAKTVGFVHDTKRCCQSQPFASKVEDSVSGRENEKCKKHRGDGGAQETPAARLWVSSAHGGLVSLKYYVVFMAGI